MSGAILSRKKKSESDGAWAVERESRLAGGSEMDESCDREEDLWVHCLLHLREVPPPPAHGGHVHGGGRSRIEQQREECDI